MQRSGIRFLSSMKYVHYIPLFITISFLCIFIYACTGPSMNKSARVSLDGALSPSALAYDSEEHLLYIAETDARRIDIFDTNKKTLSGSIKLPVKPSGLALSHDGSRLFVSGGEESGKLLAIDTGSGRILSSVDAGHTPLSPVLSPDGKKLYVCARFNDRVNIFDADTFELLRSTPALREPIAADITPDGRYLFIANHLPSGKLIPDYISDGGLYLIGDYQSTAYSNIGRESYVFSALVLVYDTKFRRLVQLIKLPNGSTGVRGLTVSPDGRNIYVTHILARYHVPTTQLERGWINTNAISVIDVDSLRYNSTVLLDDLDRGAANPWAVACTEDGANIVVTHAGTHELSIIDRKGLHERLDAVSKGMQTPAAATTPEDVPNDLSFLYGIRERIPLKGKGPRAAAVCGQDIYASLYYSDNVNRISRKNTEWTVENYNLNSNKPMSRERLGEMYFNDAELCFQEWQSCASCHPDGRADGLNWDLLNDGIGNPKNTKSLLLSHATPPVMALGVRKDAGTAVRAGMHHIQFIEMTDEVANAIDTYLMSMKPVKSPFMENGDLSSSAKRGRKIFVRAGCAECHPSPLYTDLNSYEVGTGTGKDLGRKFDTPSLVEMWRTGPYLGDGCADTIYDVLVKHNRDDKHGVISNLNHIELSDLLDFLLSL